VTIRPLHRVGTVDALSAELRARVLSGDLPPGAWLRERELTESYGVARHSLRAALRQLAAERLVRIEPNRGARVAVLDTAELRGLYELRAALETEAARLLVQRRGVEPLPDEVRAAAERLEAECSRRPPDPGAVDLAHADLHHALVSAAGSTRITEAHAALDAETRVYLLQLRPLMGPEGMAAEHRALLQGLVTDGPEALRQHIVEATERLIAAKDET
jgi:DNA-binding GntR family transcriptional regulator